MPASCTTSWWAFPPDTEKLQLDEKWAFVAKKQKHCDADDESDLFCGDQWDHVAYDPDHRLVLEVLMGKRVEVNVERLFEGICSRLAQPPQLITSDGYSAYETALWQFFGEEVVPPRTGRPGRPAGPQPVWPEDICYARVNKRRQRGRVVEISTEVVLGELADGETVSTSYLERQHATDRHRNARKTRKSYCFSKDWDVHQAMTEYTMFSYNFCWPVRTLRQETAPGCYQQRTPAMAAGLADHVWSIQEWLTFPGIQ